MSVSLLLYLCVDATRTDCHVVKVDSWSGAGAYERCIGAVPGLTKALTAPNRELHRFVCEIQDDGAKPAAHKAQPELIHQSFRLPQRSVRRPAARLGQLRNVRPDQRGARVCNPNRTHMDKPALPQSVEPPVIVWRDR